MNLTEFGWALSGRLAFPILRVISGRANQLTAAQVTRALNDEARSDKEKASEEGVRRALDRLARHGLVVSTLVGGRIVYSFNRGHLFHPELEKMIHFDRYLITKVRKEITSWGLTPVTAVLFGSAARRSGGEASDIDLLLVHPPRATEAQKKRWAEDRHSLREKVHAWTGNSLADIDWSEATLRKRVAQGEPLVRSILAEGRLVVGMPLSVVVGAKR